MQQSHQEMPKLRIALKFALLALTPMLAACVLQEFKERSGVAYYETCTDGDNLYPTQCSRVYEDDVTVTIVSGNHVDGRRYDLPSEAERGLQPGLFAMIRETLRDPPAGAAEFDPPPSREELEQCCHVAYRKTSIFVDAEGITRDVNGSVLRYALAQGR